MKTDQFDIRHVHIYTCIHINLKPREQARTVGFECGGEGWDMGGGCYLNFSKKIFKISNLLKRADGVHGIIKV